jgi:hypothetical protein
MERRDAASLLQETPDEAKATDQCLTGLATPVINVDAGQEAGPAHKRASLSTLSGTFSR